MTAARLLDDVLRGNVLLRHLAPLPHQAALPAPPGATGPSFDVLAPGKGTVLAQLADGDAAAAHAAVDIAVRAGPAWRTTPITTRSTRLHAWCDLMLACRADLAAIVSAEVGKPEDEALAEVDYAASYVRWYAEEAQRAHGDVLPALSSDRRYWVTRHAVGVCVAITPWNFPLAMVTRKAAPALAAGCTVIVKPSELSPLSALALAALAHQAGLAPETLQVLPCSRAASVTVGQVFCERTEVRHLSFTGSTPVGRALAAQCAPTLKRLALELGGHAPFLVFADADLDLAVDALLASKLRNAGQACIAVNRVLVHEQVHDALLARLTVALQGPAGQPRVLSSRQGVQTFKRQVQDATARGARLVAGGIDDGDWAVRPTVLAAATPDMLCMTQESFAPLMPVAPFSNDAQALALAHSTDHGLAAYAFTRDLNRALWLTENLGFGMVGINTVALSAAQVPFGGVRQSGLGREGGRQGLDEYLDWRTVCVGTDVRSAT